jgi:hypothetical protein
MAIRLLPEDVVFECKNLKLPSAAGAPVDARRPWVKALCDLTVNRTTLDRLAWRSEALARFDVPRHAKLLPNLFDILRLMPKARL